MSLESLESLFSSHGLSVSRETLERLWFHYEQLKKWQNAYNLVSRETLESALTRHFLDSAQVAQFIDSDKTLVDLGTGGGFPGLVLSCMGQKKSFLIESNQKKTRFLNHIIRHLSLPCEVLPERIESISGLKADYITARSLSRLKNLLMLSFPFTHAVTSCIYLKGENFSEEIKEAENFYRFRIKIKQSVTDPRGKILIIDELRVKSS